MPTHKFLTDLGLAKRAGRISFGYDEVVKQVEHGTAKTVFLASDAAVNTVKRVTKLCEYYEMKAETVDFTTAEIGKAAGRKPTAVFATMDKGFDILLHKSLKMNGGNA